MTIVYATTIISFFAYWKKPNIVQKVAAAYLRKMNPKVESTPLSTPR